MRTTFEPWTNIQLGDPQVGNDRNDEQNKVISALIMQFGDCNYITVFIFSAAVIH